MRTRVAGAKCVNDVEVPRFSRSGVGLRSANFIKSEYIIIPMSTMQICL